MQRDKFHLQLSSLVPTREKKLYFRSLFLICTETYGKDYNTPVALDSFFVRSMVMIHLRYFVPFQMLNALNVFLELKQCMKLLSVSGLEMCVSLQCACLFMGNLYSIFTEILPSKNLWYCLILFFSSVPHSHEDFELF